MRTNGGAGVPPAGVVIDGHLYIQGHVPGTHMDDENTRAAWRGLRGYLEGPPE
jgi:hypothetical protein